MRWSCWWIVMLPLAGSGCGTGETNTRLLPRVVIQVYAEGEGTGSARFDLPFEPLPCENPAGGVIACTEFEDAGLGGSVTVTAIPSEGSVVGGWRGCESSNGPACVLAFEDAPATLDATVRFDLAAACPVPIAPAFPTAGAAPVPPPATLGVNLIQDASFDDVVAIGAPPDGFGYWRGDRSASVVNGTWSTAGPQPEAIAPRTSSRMLQFWETSPTGGGLATSEQTQIIDVSALSTQINAGSLRATGEVWFNRVGGCGAAGTSFGMQLIAYDGSPVDVASRWQAGIAEAARQNVPRTELEGAPGSAWWLRYRAGTVASTGNQWQRVQVSLDVPAGTTLIQVVVYANRSEEEGVEFHGHFADDVSVVLGPR